MMATSQQEQSSNKASNTPVENVSSNSATIPAIVAYAPENGKMNLKYEELRLHREVNEHEVLVRMISAGICHTDLVVGSVPDGIFGNYPKVLGHEGAGYVEAVGPGVMVAKVGDPVLLSYTYCDNCDICTTDNPVYCEKFNEYNAAANEEVWKNSKGEKTGGKYFGQSSFSALSVVDEKSVVNVSGLIKTNDELKMFSPLGCGLMTGAGAVLNTATAKPHDIILVTGIGAVGLGCIMAAKIAGCKAIIAVDRVPSRLEIAKQLGATHILDTNTLDANREGNFAQDVQQLVSGQRITYAFDTTGVPPVMNAAIQSLGKRGKLIQIGVPPMDPSVILPMSIADFFGGTKGFEINYLGEAKAQDMLPKMIQWYREGRFPIDKFIKYYPAKDFQQALEDMKAAVIKPVLLF